MECRPHAAAGCLALALALAEHVLQGPSVGSELDAGR
ncbi:hypothetical protein HaLaN_30975, partial [Haematococcus lacustris]